MKQNEDRSLANSFVRRFTIVNLFSRIAGIQKYAEIKSDIAPPKLGCNKIRFPFFIFINCK